MKGRVLERAATGDGSHFDYVILENGRRRIAKDFNRKVAVGSFVEAKEEEGEIEVLTRSALIPPDKPVTRDVAWRRPELAGISDGEWRARMLRRSKTISRLREYLTTRGYVEVETPVLQVQTSGEADTFETFHQTNGEVRFLRISPELYLKRMLVAGFERVFELGKVFRNEGISRWHSPEFTTLEIYEAYATHEDARRLVERLIEEVWGYGNGPTSSVVVDGRHVPEEALKGIPGFVWRNHLPIDESPLSPELDGYADRSELYIDGVEVANVGPNLLDVEEQAKKLPEMKDYLEALRAGLPPSIGIGIGIDRLVAKIAGVDNLRDVTVFPDLRTG